jgi:hypothetical protein
MRFALSLIFASVVVAQNSATITGTVSDTDGVALAKAAVQAKNTATGAEYKTESASTGSYALARLPGGTYELLARVPGMLPFEQKNILVDAAQTLRLNIQLQDFLSLNTAGEDREFFAGMTTRHKTAAGPTPHMANGKPDFSGVWLGTLLQDAGKPELTPSAQALFKERIGNNMKDVPSSRCQPNGVTLYGIIFTYRVVQTPTYLVMIAEHDEPHYRQIFLDGREHPKDLAPTWLGHSIGRWEGDTLVVDTVGFNGQAWIDLEGHPFTEKTHITERYRRPDLGHLEVEFTIEDPSAYAKPWTIKRTSDLAPKAEEVQEYICTENNRDVTHLVGK